MVNINKFVKIFSLSIFFVVVFLLTRVATASADTHIWDGGDADDNNWSSCDNWSLSGANSCPSAGDTVQFDGLSTKASTIDGAFAGTIDTFNINAGYTGGTAVITQARSLTVATAFAQADGTFSGASQAINMNGSFTLTGGVFTSTSGTMTVTGAFTHTVGGVFNHNNGTVLFNGNNKIWDFNSGISGGNSGEFWNFTFNTTAANPLTINTGDSLVTSGLLTLTDGTVNTGTFVAKGNVTVSSAFNGGTSPLIFSGSTATQVFNLTGGEGTINTAITINKTSGTVSLSSGLVMDAGALLTVTSGTLDFNGNTFSTTGNITVNGGIFSGSTNTLTFGGTTTLSSGTLTLSSGMTYISGAFTHTVGGTFNHNSGTVIYNGNNKTWDFSSAISGGNSGQFWNFTDNNTSLNPLIINTGDSLVVNNTLLLTDGAINTGTLSALGNVTVSSTYNGGTASLTFSGSAATQNFDLTGGEGTFDSDITVNKTSGAVNLLSTLTMDAASQDLAIQGGTFDISGQTLTVSGSGYTFGVKSGGNLQLQGNETVTNAPTFQAGSSVTYDGTSTPYTMKAWTYNNATVIINGGATSVFNLSGARTFANLTITSGIFNLANNNLTVSTAFSNEGTLRWRGTETLSLPAMDTDSGTIEFRGDGDAGADTYTVTTLSATYYNLTINSSDGATDVFQLGAALDINNNLTITAGTFDVTTSNWLITVGGSFAQVGLFTQRAGTVLFDDATKTSIISGSTTFNDFDCVTQDKNIQFTAGTTQTIGGDLTLTGAASHLIVLRSTTTDSHWNLTVSGTHTVNYVNVEDSDASGGNLILQTNSFDAGNNHNWQFYPTVNWSTSTQNGAESIGSFTVTANLSFVPSSDVTIPYTLSGTATGGGTDYSITASPLVIAAGQTTGDIIVTIINDSVDESDETVIVTIGDPTNGIKGTTSVQTITITDNDDPPTIAVADAVVTEGEGVATITVTLSGSSDQQVEVNYDTFDGTALAGFDFTAVSMSVIWDPGQTGAKTFTVPITDDSDAENSETVLISLGSPVNATISDGSATLTIYDNGDMPSVVWTSASQNTSEATAATTVTAQISSVSAFDVTVPFTVTGTATGSGTDYSITASPIIISAGNTTADVTITIVNDLFDENDETIIVTMGDPTNATKGATTVHTATINDNDDSPTVSWTTESQSATESGGAMVLVAELSTVSGRDVSVPYTMTGTATNSGTDYSITASPITIPAGTTTVNITITIVNDTLDENNETVIVTMGSPTNATQGATTVHTATIEDNDALPTVSWTTSSQSASEGIGTMTVTARLSVVSGRDVTVPFTISGTATDFGTDYSITASPITISAGVLTADITLTIIDDLLDEENQTIIVTMGAPTNAIQGTTTVHTATIEDNDPTPRINWTASAQTVSEGVGTVTITAEITEVSELTVSIPFTVTGIATGSGADYTITASPITISGGSTTADITLTIVDDSSDENSETVIVTMGSVLNAVPETTTVNTTTITDNDNSPTVQFNTTSSSGSEGTTPALLQVDLSAASGLSVSVDYAVTGGTATGGGVDFTLASGTLTFDPGQSSKNISVTINDDLLDENNETLVVTLSNPVNSTLGANTGHTYTILDDDNPPTVVWTSASQNASEAAEVMTVTAELSNTSSFEVTVPFTVTGTATGGATDYSITASPLTIPAGGLRAEVTITLVNDVLHEDNETVIITMGNPTNASQGAVVEHTATITDNDDSPTVSWAASSQSATEAVGDIVLTAQLSAISALDVTLPFTLTGSATGTVDYTITASPITISAGATTANITISVINDVLYENSETVIVTMGSPTNAVKGTTEVFTATINDNDTAPTVSWTSDSSSSLENAGTVTITAELNTVSGADVTVPFVVTGTATGSGTDYSITASPITISAGAATATITITVVNDVLDENNETVIVTMGAPSNASQGTTTVYTATITDNDDPPIASWSSSSQTVSEAVGVVTVTAELSAPSGLDVTVPFVLSGTAAGSGVDYSADAPPFIISAGATTGSVSITVINDSLDENDETIILTMDSPTNAIKGLVDVHTVTITDNDTAGISVVQTSGSTDISEVGTTDTYSIVLNSQPTSNVVIAITPDSQMTTSVSSVTFTSVNWSTPQVITVSAIDDSVEEGFTTGIISHTSLSDDSMYNALPIASVIANITDNDAAGVSVSAASGDTTEVGGTATFTVVLTSQPTANVTIAFSSSDSTEGTVGVSQLVFTSENWSQSQGVTVTGVDDYVDDGNISYQIILAAAVSEDAFYSGFNPSDVNFINVDNDTAGFTVGAISGPTTEAGGTATFTVVLNSEPTADVAIALSSSNTAEGLATTASITFTTGNWSVPQTATATGVDDFVDDGDVTYSIILAAAVSADPNYSGLNPADVSVINSDNDTAGITITESSGSTAVTEGGATDTYTLVLTSQPTYNVFLTVTPDAQVSVTSTTVTFTTTDWSTPQTVTVSAVDDTTVESTHTGSVSHVVSSSDVLYNGISLTSVSVSITDNDTSDGGNNGGGGGGGGTHVTERPITISITYPTGGSTLVGGRSAEIQWTYTGSFSLVNISFSTDGGANYSSIVRAAANSGSYSWPIPEMLSTQGRILIQAVDASDSIQSSSSVSVFFVTSDSGGMIDTTNPFNNDTVGAASQSSETFPSFPGYVAIGSLIKLPDDGNPETQFDSAVYYIGADKRRHPFPNERVYMSWYNSFDRVEIVAADAVSSIQLGSMVTYAPGYLVKFCSVPNVYVVDSYGQLRWVVSEDIARNLFGTNWNSQIKDISDAFYSSYKFGQDIRSTVDYSVPVFSALTF